MTVPRPRATILHGWGMANRSRSWLYRPRDAEELLAALADAEDRSLSITARGAGLSYGDAALNQGGAVVDVSGLRRIVDFDPIEGRIRVEAGATIEDVWRHTLPHGWWPPVVPGTMQATIGGCVAMNVHGKNHARAGAIGRRVLSVRIATPDGTLRDVDGGRTTAPDGLALRDVVGAQGLTGTVIEVALELERVHSGYLSVTVEPSGSLVETFDALDRGTRDADYTVAWIDCTGGHAGRGVLHHASYLPPDHALAGRGLDAAEQRLPAKVAGLLPRRHAWRVLRAFTNRLGIGVLNAGRYRTARLRGRTRYHQPHAAFHFLLDYVPGWKRAYGPHGLIQYQLFAPAESAREAFADALRLQRRLGVPSFLGVMKRHAAEDSAADYCLDGYSLALDFPVGRGARYVRLMRLCRSLDDVQREHGGRVYAAKDAVSVGELPRRRHPHFSSSLVRRWERGRDERRSRGQDRRSPGRCGADGAR